MPLVLGYISGGAKSVFMFPILVHLQAAGGVDGWAPVRSQCADACADFLQAATYAGSVLRYMVDGTAPVVRDRLTDEARAVGDQLGALGLLLQCHGPGWATRKLHKEDPVST